MIRDTRHSLALRSFSEGGTRNTGQALRRLPGGTCSGQALRRVPGGTCFRLRPVGATARQAGQAIIFLVMVLIILVFVVLWNFDLHKILFTKYLSQNGGDAAAMAAARWQATSLNIMGDLNIMQAVALSDLVSGAGGEDVPAILSELQARLCYVGPMIGMMAAQQAAKNNGVHENESFTAYLRAHARTIREDYPEFIEEAYPGCLEEYATMLDVVCDNGVAAGPENMVLYNDYLGDHTLLNPDFYEAIATRAWCWFFFNDYDLLKSYHSYHDWAPLPMILNPSPVNCEFFSLQLSRYPMRLQPETIDALNDLKRERLLSGNAIDPASAGFSATFYLYSMNWYEPFPMDNSDFPSAGQVRDQFNYAGADSAVRIVAEDLELRSPGNRIDAVTWTAAAKPFGFLNENDKPTLLGLVLPAFREVRLIPVDASSAINGGSFDLAWRRHCENHLPEYVSSGLKGLSAGCSYCQCLRTWENAAFRNQGIIWLRANSALCYTTYGGPGGSSGGTRRGH